MKHATPLRAATMLDPSSPAAFRESARALVDAEITPYLARWERQGTVTRSLFEAMGRAGVFGIGVPVDQGGLGLDLAHGIAFGRAVMREPAAGVCTSLSVLTHLVAPLLAGHGTPGQRDRWLRPILAGEAVASVALTEPGGGSDLVRSVAATARSEPDGWVLRGEKTFITNAPLADVLIVLARTTPGASALGLTLFLVPADLPGVVVTPLTTAGLHTSPTGRVSLEDCRLPREAVLGRPGLALALLAGILPQERLAIAAGALACARWALERTARLVGPTGQAMAELAWWDAELEAAETFVDVTVEQIGGADDQLDAALAKTASARLAQRVVQECARLSGPDAFRDDESAPGMLTVLRDVRVFSVYGGSCETVRDMAATEILRGARTTGQGPHHAQE
ncbi:acyl-CoA dehydrogenase family protein [Streptomyces sp. R28]|uniref:Acyl-CoA dehydrogenase family protein n=1 Tax=Streptomyces sp. R28 TaxID=3238628 RepID=A0AB39QAP5_9ACTN